MQNSKVIMGQRSDDNDQQNFENKDKWLDILEGSMLKSLKKLQCTYKKRIIEFVKTGDVQFQYKISGNKIFLYRARYKKILGPEIDIAFSSEEGIYSSVDALQIIPAILAVLLFECHKAQKECCAFPNGSVPSKIDMRKKSVLLPVKALNKQLLTSVTAIGKKRKKIQNTNVILNYNIESFEGDENFLEKINCIAKTDSQAYQATQTQGKFKAEIRVGVYINVHQKYTDEKFKTPLLKLAKLMVVTYAELQKKIEEQHRPAKVDWPSHLGQEQSANSFKKTLNSP